MTKASLRLLYVIVFGALVVSACAPKPLNTPVAVSVSTQISQAIEPTTTQTIPTEAPVLETVTATAVVEAQPSPTLATIDLSGPPMEVGSTFTYVDGSTLVAVPKGEFIMGHGGEDDPVHKVFLDDFWIYSTEVSNREYALCVAMGQCSPPDPKLDPYFDPIGNPKFTDPTYANDPVVGVNWDQATAYCKMVKGRLPTEAEWEKTARGPDGNIYPWGKANPSCDLANVGRCNPGTTKVTAYAQGKSYYDAVNMAGNVFEWMADWYSASYYGKSPTENPLGPETGSFRSVRSASFSQDAYLAESARRFRFKPSEARNDLGFRCVVEDPLAFAPWCQMVAYVGADQGGSLGDTTVPVPNCPDVNVTTAGFCNTNSNPKQPAASLNFSPDSLPAGTLVTYPGGCSLNADTADPNDYYCTSGGAASIQAQCTVPDAPLPATCPAGYTQNGDICEWTGGGTAATACLPGVTYDPLTQCCGSTPGVSDTLPICPQDAPYYSGGQCVPWPSSDFGPLVTVNVALGNCSTGNTGGGCNLTPNSCNTREKPYFCASSCTCVSSPTECK